jgi:hypothetical protein
MILRSSAGVGFLFLPEPGRLPTSLKDSNDFNILRTDLIGTSNNDEICIGDNPDTLDDMIAHLAS